MKFKGLNLEKADIFILYLFFFFNFFYWFGIIPSIFGCISVCVYIYIYIFDGYISIYKSSKPLNALANK